MKLKEKLALEATEARDFISNENRRAYGEGFLDGFEKARELAIELRRKPAWIMVRDMPMLGEEEVEK